MGNQGSLHIYEVFVTLFKAQNGERNQHTKRADRHVGNSPLVAQLIEHNKTLLGRIGKLNHALKTVTADRDALERQKDEHAEQFPDCGSAEPKPLQPTCPSCGAFRIAGPIPCQGCGFVG